ncbi:MAG: TOBE domain-containing protein, partial [Gammaproteobacteria bacterium]
MKVSARNQLKGRVIQIKRGAVTAQVSVDIGGGNT